MWTICRKELADHFSSARFLILFCLVVIVALVSTYLAATNVKEALEGTSKPAQVFLLLFTTPGKFISLVQFIAFFGPLLGIIMGFDAINRERQHRTLAKLVSQPIFRDAVINGKFLAGVITVSIALVALLLLLSATGLMTVGVVPGQEEIGRLVIYLVVSIAYVSFWLGLAILFSILFRSLATSALAAVALWVFFSFFMGFASALLADAVSPVKNADDPEEVVANQRVADAASLASPAVLYSQATSTILDPYRRTRSNVVLTGPMEKLSLERFENPLSLDQSILVVWPYLTSLGALTLVCFGLSYIIFLRQEIRSV
jgi:ABC-2 type transport system permease protein